jgi:starch phosphorylase
MSIIENDIIPTYYGDKNKWATLMKNAIKTSEAYFNSDRMVIEYYNRLYNPIAKGGKEEGDDTSSVKVAENPNLDAWTFSNIK